MPSGGTLRITLEARDEPDTPGRRTAMLVVQDTGTGMQEEVRQRIFDPFFTTKARAQGTGLGLAIVHGIVADHHGRIHVNSVAGEGTRVTVSLPCCTPGAPKSAVAGPTAQPAGTGQVLLVADDNRQVRAIMAGTLEAAGYRVLQAVDGIAATEVFAAHPETLALAILDVDMPRMSGLECLERLRARRPALPVIVISGLADVHLTDEQARNATLLKKPFRMAKLTALVARMLSTPQPESASVNEPD